MTSIVSLTLFEFRQYPVVWPMKRENMRKVDTLKKTAKLEKMQKKLQQPKTLEVIPPNNVKNQNE